MKPAPTNDSDPWNRLDDTRRAIYETGEAAAAALRKYETIERWHEVGNAAAALMADAMTYGHSNVASGKGYNTAWNQLSQHVPTVRSLDKAARSAAVWMSQNWADLTLWLDTMPASERLKLNHPTAVRRRYDAAHKPPPAPGTAGAPTRENNAQTIIRLQEEVDMLRKRGGSGLMPGASVEELVEEIALAHNPQFMRRAAEALVKRADAEERQDAIEGKAAKRKPTAKA